MKPYLIIIIVVLLVVLLYRHEQAEDEVDVQKQVVAQKDREFQVFLGYEQPVYVIRVKGKTWTSLQRPVRTDTETSFVDSTTGQIVNLPGTAFVSEE